jgi:hypothetical protein
MAQYERAKEKERQEIERRRLGAERLKRENAKSQISHDYNIGQQICKDGNVKYSYFSGFYIMGHPSHRNTSHPARIMAFLEGFSPDGYRIKIRISGWAPIGRTAPRPSDYLRMDGVVIQPEIVQWDDVKEWYLCRLINHH